MIYKVEIRSKALKALQKLPKEAQPAIRETIRNLSSDPRPRGSLQLTNSEQRRIRVGNYRVLYTIEDDHLVVIVVKIGHRKDVYK